MTAKVRIKRAAIPRAGYQYQDLAGIEILIRHYRDPQLFAWVQLEADDKEYRALDDVIAARCDGSFEILQIKFTVDPSRFEMDWDWLLDATESGTSMLEKWASTFTRVAARGSISTAGLRTNRRPSAAFSNCLIGTRVDLDRLPADLRLTVERACGGAEQAEAFFAVFDFTGDQPDLDRYEQELRDQLVPTDTDPWGWLALRDSVRRWATYRNQPEPDGRILREHLVQLITKRRPKPIRQDFVVPDGYRPPSDAFDRSIRSRIAAHPITVVWGTPGRGKSTYLSHLAQKLEEEGAAVTRHHYFLSAEDSNTNRISYAEISTSLLDQLAVRHPAAMTGVPQDGDNLRAAIDVVGQNLAAQGKRLYVLVDGLDHVWRDTRRVDQLNHLFNQLLPLPSNVNLIVGTQRVSDDQLPGRLLTIANDEDWVEIPRMDEVAVHHWIRQQDKARPLILRFGQDPDRRAELIEQVALAFFKISQGHPLHLIYAYEGLVRAGHPTSPDDIELLPPCPDGDIREYYRGLWVRLSPHAQNALHMLAGSAFFWPSLGIRQVLGDFSEIDHLLEHRNAGMVPFHPSIFAWVREERLDHEERYRALLPKIIDWLASDAPEYWRWGWLWLARASNGDFTDLLHGANRDWVVESFCKGWSDRQIENILAAAEQKTFADGDLPRTVTLRSLKTRVSNAREFQARDFATFRATALAVSENSQQTLNLLDDIHDLSDDEITALARLSTNSLSSQVLSECRQELARRVNAWIVLRHRPAHEFTKLSDKFLSVSSLMNQKMVRGALRYARGFREPARHVIKFIKYLANAQNVEGLLGVRRALSASTWKPQRRLIRDALIRATCMRGADIREVAPLGKESVSAFAASWYLWRDPQVEIEVHLPAPPSKLARERHSPEDNADLVTFFYDSFWIAFYVGLRANGRNYSLIHPRLAENELGWIPKGRAKLEQIARAITEGMLVPTFSAVYSKTAGVEPVSWPGSPESEFHQYRAFREALRKIAVDLHILSASPGDALIPLPEFSVARQSAHWEDEDWVVFHTTNRTPILDKAATAALLTSEAAVLSAKVIEFSERLEKWTQLADLARLYGDGRQSEFLARAGECLVGYGWRKDLGAMDVLDAVVEVSGKDPDVARTRLDRLVPIIDVITEFTDGDETNHVRSELIEVVAKVAPERLPSLYEHHLADDEYAYADECLVEFVKVMNLDTPETAALARTFLDRRTLSVLQARATDEPTARTLLDAQNVFLGRTGSIRTEDNSDAREREEEKEEESRAAQADPTSFGFDDFAAVAAAADKVHYDDRREFMVKWLNFWKGRGKATRALSAIRSYFETQETTFGSEEVLDEAFSVSLAVEGKDAAYPWLVQAHVHRHGWQNYYTSQQEAMTRIRLAAHHYPDSWLRYIKDTSVPPPYYQRRGYSFVLGYRYLVRYLMLVGQAAVADSVAAAFLDTLVEEVREQPIPKAPWFH